jgi:hypothetical protein
MGRIHQEESHSESPEDYGIPSENRTRNEDQVTTMFWILGADDDADRLEWVPNAVGYETVICPINPEHQHRGKRLGELVVKAPAVSNDVLWSVYSECLVSNSVRKRIQSVQLRGVTFKQAKVNGAKGQNDNFCELVITGWGGVAPPESGVHLITACHFCGYREYSAANFPSAIVDVNQWDGSDFFLVWPLPQFIFLSDRAKEFFVLANVSGIKLLPLESLKSADDDMGYSPGSLRYWLPDKLAHRLGDPFGIY